MNKYFSFDHGMFMVEDFGMTNHYEGGDYGKSGEPRQDIKDMQ
jgi:hypothetical protein